MRSYQVRWTCKRSIQGFIVLDKAKRCVATLPGFSDEVEQRAKIVAAAPALMESLQDLVEDLEEAHEYDVANGHAGDDPKTCLYCQHLDVAERLIEKLKGGEW